MKNEQISFTKVLFPQIVFSHCHLPSISIQGYGAAQFYYQNSTKETKWERPPDEEISPDLDFVERGLDDFCELVGALGQLLEEEHEDVDMRRSGRSDQSGGSGAVVFTEYNDGTRDHNREQNGSRNKRMEDSFATTVATTAAGGTGIDGADTVGMS